MILAEYFVAKKKHLSHNIVIYYSISKGALMSILTQITDIMQEVFDNAVETTSLACDFVQRKRKLTASAFAKILVFGWLENPDASYTDLAHTARLLGVEVSRQAIEKRMTYKAAETLKATLEVAASQVVEMPPQTLPLLNSFTGVYVQDSTTITLPDELRTVWKGGRGKNDHEKASLKLHLRFDVLTGVFEQFQLTDGATSDSKAADQFEQLPPKSLRLADLGYFTFDTFEKLTQNDIYWISPYKVRCHLYDEAGERIYLDEYLSTKTVDAIDLSCFIGVKKRLPIRFIAVRRSEQETKSRRRHIKREAKRKGATPSDERLRLAGWDLYITNIDTSLLTAEQIAPIYSIRWQVELMFKSFKSIGNLNETRRNKAENILCEVYAKLLAQLVRHWIMLASHWRCIQQDIIKAAKLIGRHARALTMSYHKSKTALLTTLRTIKKDLGYSDYGKHRAGKCTTYRRLKMAENP